MEYGQEFSLELTEMLDEIMSPEAKEDQQFLSTVAAAIAKHGYDKIMKLCHYVNTKRPNRYDLYWYKLYRQMEEGDQAPWTPKSTPNMPIFKVIDRPDEGFSMVILLKVWQDGRTEATSFDRQALVRHFGG